VRLAIAKLPFAAKLALEDVRPGIVPAGVDLFESLKLSETEKAARWKATLAKLNSMPIPNNPGRKGAATYDEAKALLQTLAENPVVKNMARHVPGGGCFAKSMIGHLEWLSAGFDKESSLGVFDIWNPEFPEPGAEPKVAFHAARAVRASDGGWWVLDPLFNPDGPVKLEAWGSETTFVGEGNRLLPNGQGAFKFNPSQLWNWTTPTSGLIDYGSPRYNGMMPAIRDRFLAKAGLRAPVALTSEAVMSDADRATLAQGRAARGVLETSEPAAPVLRFPQLPGSSTTSPSVAEAVAALNLVPRTPVSTDALRLARRVEQNESPAVASQLLPYLLNIAVVGNDQGPVVEAFRGFGAALDSVQGGSVIEEALLRRFVRSGLGLLPQP
jgi:hypothetical protein